MIRRWSTGLACFWLVVASATLPAAENPLDAVSTDAAAVIRLKNPKATITKVGEFVDQVVPGIGMQIHQQADGLGLAISNPTMAGVNREADWWVAVYPNPGEQPPSIVYVIPATDLKAMKEGLGEAVKFTEHGTYGVYTDNADAADKTAARIKGSGKSIAGLIEKESTAVFDKGDAAVYINVARLVAAYRAQITEFREHAAQQFSNVPTEIPGTPGFNPKAMVDSLSGIFDVLMQGLDDTQSCTIALMVTKEGLAFEDLVRVAKDSKTDKLLQKSPPAALGVLTSLPAGALGYLGAQGDMSDLMQFSMKMMGAMVQDEEQGKKLQAAMADMQKVKLGAISASFNVGSLEEGAIRSVTITETTEPAKVREFSQKLFNVMGTLQTPGIKQSYDLKRDSEKYGANSADVLTVKTEVGEGGGPEVEMMDRLTKALYGPDGMVTRTVYLKDKVVATSGGGKDGMTAALAALETTSAANGAAPAFQKARGKVGEKANLVVLFDLPGTVTKVLSLVADSGMLPPGVPINGEMFKSMDLPPSYLGMGLATEAQGLRVKTSIPVEQLQGIARIVQTFILMQAGGFPQEQQEEQ